MLQIRFLDWGHLKTKTNRRVSHVTLTYFRYLFTNVWSTTQYCIQLMLKNQANIKTHPKNFNDKYHDFHCICAMIMLLNKFYFVCFWLGFFFFFFFFFIIKLYRECWNRTVGFFVAALMSIVLNAHPGVYNCIPAGWTAKSKIFLPFGHGRDLAAFNGTGL